MEGTAARLPVQWVLRKPGGGRSYAGMVNGAPLRPGQQVVVLPGGQRTTVTEVRTADGPLDEAAVGLSVSVELADDVDAILDEIDEVLEENAEEFVRSYVQKGGK